MAPGIINDHVDSMASTDSKKTILAASIRGGHATAHTRLTKPLVYMGSLDNYQYQDCTPAIGREYSNVQVRDILAMPDREDFIRDLAVTISQRGVVFLRNQDVNPLEMKELCEILTRVAGCPTSSGLHVHPLTEESSELGDQISVISSEKQAKGGGLTHQLSDTSRLASVGWHADITFEPVPSDYAMLKIHTLPATGGDTMWASGYEIYDRLSPAMQTFLEGLTATHDAKFFLEEAERLGNPLRKTIRGNPLNQGDALCATHPVIRTNPVTGWRSVFVNKGFTKRINGVTKDESDLLLKYLLDLVVHNHDAQVRFKWNKNDLAIWDNRSNWHCATYDYAAARAGDRVAEKRPRRAFAKNMLKKKIATVGIDDLDPSIRNLSSKSYSSISPKYLRSVRKVELSRSRTRPESACLSEPLSGVGRSERISGISYRLGTSQQPHVEVRNLLRK